MSLSQVCTVQRGGRYKSSSIALVRIYQDDHQKRKTQLDTQYLAEAVLFWNMTKSHTKFVFTNNKNRLKIQRMNNREIAGRPQKTKEIDHQALKFYLQICLFLPHCFKFIRVSRTHFTSSAIINGFSQKLVSYLESLDRLTQ